MQNKNFTILQLLFQCRIYQLAPFYLLSGDFSQEEDQYLSCTLTIPRLSSLGTSINYVTGFLIFFGHPLRNAVWGGKICFFHFNVHVALQIISIYFRWLKLSFYVTEIIFIIFPLFILLELLQFYAYLFIVISVGLLDFWPVLFSTT